MAKSFKRNLSLLLAMIMIVGTFAVFPLTSSADSTYKETLIPENFWGTLYNGEGDPEGEGIVDYKGTYVNAHPNSGVDLDEWFRNICLCPMDFDEDDEDRCYIGITAKDNRVISGIDVSVDTDVSNGEPLIYAGDSGNAVSGVKNGSVYSFTDINSASVKLSGSDSYLYVTKIEVYCADYVAPATYTVTWKNGSSVLETDAGVVEGTAPSYDGAAPTKAADDQYTYTFSGWTDGTTTYGLTDALPAVTADVTYTAVFTAKVAPVSYNKDSDELFFGVVLQNPGDTIDTSGTSKKLSFIVDVLVDYYNDGSSVDTYIAGEIWKSVDSFYINDNNEFICYNYNSTSKFTPAEGKTFMVYYVPYDCMWYIEEVEVPAADPSGTYTVTWNNYDGTLLETDVDVPAGSDPSYNGDEPTKPDSEYYTYEFAGWGPVVGPVKGNITYTARFRIAPKQEEGLIKRFTFDIPSEVDEMTYISNGESAWVWSYYDPSGYDLPSYAYEGGAFMLCYSYVYGVGSKKADEWMITPAIEIPKYETHMTFYATNINSSYPETFDVCVGTSADPSSMTVIRTVTPATGYNSWEFYDIDLSDYAGQTVYVGFHDTSYDMYECWIDLIEFRHTDEIVKYTITWNNWDGTNLETDEDVPYGTMPEYNSAEPVREADNDYEYTFAGWDNEIVATAGNRTKTYTATYTATAHNYEFVDGVLQCVDCGKLYNGLYFADNGEIRYYVDGVATYAGLVQDTDGSLYYINSYKKAVKNCEYAIGEAKTNGLLSSGRYYFGEDGKLTEQPTVDKNGLVLDEDGEIRYYENGLAAYAGLVKDGDDYYYINSAKKAVKGCEYGVTEAKANGLLPAGVYYFGEDGKMTDPPAGDKNGVSFDEDGEIRYYVDGVATYAGLVQDGDDYYYINSSKKAVKGTAYRIGESKTNGLLPAGLYTFGADGKLVLPE